jgi:hypothetical protein
LAYKLHPCPLWREVDNNLTDLTAEQLRCISTLRNKERSVLEVDARQHFVQFSPWTLSKNTVMPLDNASKTGHQSLIHA